jgi:DNA repair protein RAD50
MSSIDKIGIRGIRSFSPAREEVVEFYAPLTMVVGANGCGKTTIIECLKYACCGSLPPGSRSGQLFVNDPQMYGKPEVKASIKLKFRNRKNEAMVCTRSLALTQKKAKLEFRALDGAIKTTDASGNRVSTSHKCTDLDNQIPLLLGVSKSVLENVIFCHQEDSSWPLQDPKELKKRFDDIFESSRYTKALESIKKKKTELGNGIKVLVLSRCADSFHTWVCVETGCAKRTGGTGGAP